MSKTTVNIEPYLPNGITFDIYKNNKLTSVFDELEVKFPDRLSNYDFDENDFVLAVKSSNFFHALLKLKH